MLGVVQGRIKSLHSMHRKMARKGVSLREIFDARALRVVVDDQLGRKLQPAIEACYAIQPRRAPPVAAHQGRTGRLHLQPQALRVPSRCTALFSVSDSPLAGAVAAHESMHGIYPV